MPLNRSADLGRPNCHGDRNGLVHVHKASRVSFLSERLTFKPKATLMFFARNHKTAQSDDLVLAYSYRASSPDSNGCKAVVSHRDSTAWAKADVSHWDSTAWAKADVSHRDSTERSCVAV